MSEEEKKVEGEPEASGAEATMEDAREASAADEVIPAETEAGEVTVVEMPHRDLRPGMFIRVHERIIDTNSKGEARQRVQIFEGLLLGLRGANISRTMTVRKNAKGWMVEKVFPLSSPNIEKVEVVKQYRARRAKLSFLRDRFKRKLREVKVK